MRNKYPLTTQTTKLFIVIRKNKKISMDLIKSYCDEFLENYAFIEHKQDIDPLNAMVIPVHYHIVGNALKKKTPLSTHLNDIVRYFRFENANGIQIDKYDNYISALQYLVHKNNPEKTQHSLDEVITNIPVEEFNLYMASEQTEIISFDMVYSTCLKAKNIVDVIQAIGFKTYAKYRSTIHDIYFSIKQKQEVLEELKEYKKLQKKKVEIH